MKRTAKIALIVAASAFAVLPLRSQTTPQSTKPSFEVVSIKPSPPNINLRGGGPRGDRLTLQGASLRMLLNIAYQPLNSEGQPLGQIQIIGGPSWMESDLYDIQAKADCSGGVISRQQMQLMMRSMLEDRFQLKAHMETRELPIYNLVVAKDGPKLKVSEDQTPPALGPGGPPQPCGDASGARALPPRPPPPAPGQRGGPFAPGAPAPRGAMMIMMNPQGLTMQAGAVPIGNLVNMLQQAVGRPIIDKTGLTGLFDFKLQFSPEGLTLPGPPPGAGPGPGPIGPAGAPGGGGTAPAAADPVPLLFTAIQELGLRLESAKGPVEVLVVDSAQKPTEN